MKKRNNCKYKRMKHTQEKRNRKKTAKLGEEEKQSRNVKRKTIQKKNFKEKNIDTMTKQGNEDTKNNRIIQHEEKIKAKN